MTIYVSAERSYTGVEMIEFVLDALPEGWDLLTKQQQFEYAEYNAKRSSIRSDAYVESGLVSHLQYWNDNEAN